MNKDEAVKCLELSKQFFSEGNTNKSVKFAKKSLTLFESTETKDWIEFLSTQSATTAEPKEDATIRKRAAKPKEEEEKRYTPQQVAAISKILKMKRNGDLYGILNLEKDASDADIKKAYRKLALTCHPGIFN
jgi:DnaJ domain